MVRNYLIFVGLFLSINAFGQYPRIILKQLEKASEQGQLILANSDSNAVWTSNLKVTVDSFLVLYGDTIEGGINYEKIQDTIAFMLEAGLGISMTYNDADGEFLIESLALEDSIYNGTASPITKGTPLYAVGVQGNYWSVAPADASDISKLPAVVIAGEDISAGATGLGLLKGHIKQVSTVGFADGDEVYVGVGGGYTNVKPKGESNYVQRLGTVIKGNDANGSGIINLGEVQSVSNLNPGNIFIGDTDSTITTRVYIVDSTRVNATNDSIVYYQNGVQIGADVFSATGVWTEDASYVYYNGGKNVGIGTTTPFRELHVKNSENNKTVILIENTENSPFSTAELNLGLGSQTFNFVNYSDSSASTIDGLAVKNKGVITTSNGMDGIIYAPINGQNYFLFNSRFDHDLLYVDATNDKIGIKDTTPTATFDVTGWVNITDSLVVNDIRVTGTGAGTINGVTTDATLTGDGTSGTPLSVVDDGHNHVISNVDFLQDSLTAKANASELSNYVTIAGTETITGAKTFTSDIVVQNEETNTNAAELDLYKKNGSNTGEVQNGDNVGKINFKAESGATNSTGASIESVVTTLFGNEIGSDLIFKTASPLNSRPLTEAMRIDKLGNISLDSTLFVDATNNRVGIGTTSPSVKLQVDGQIIAGDVNSNDYDNVTTNPGFHIGVVDATAASRAMNLVHYGGTTSSASALLRLRRSRGTSLGDYTKVEDGDILGFLQWMYSNGTGWGTGGTIRTVMDGATGTGDFPTRLEFLTTADGTTTHAVKMTIKNDGGIEIPFLLNASTANTMYYNTTTDEISYSSSSIRFKNDIEDLPIGLNELMKLRPTRYTYIPDGKKDYGFIAEQVYDVGLTEFVTFNQDNQIEGLKDKYFMILNTKAIQEQQAIIETQEQKITDLENTIQSLITRIENLENK